ncbi:MAG: hypothetical protein ACP5H2_09310, partial [Solirubrobacteraceae bacterium]
KATKALTRAGPNLRGQASTTTGRAPFSATTLKSFVSCIRKNGYPQMPNAGKAGSVFSHSLLSNKKFKKALVKCEGVLTAAFRGAPGAGGGSSTSTTSTTQST